MAKKNKSKGLGDTIEKITTATGIKKAVEIFTNGKDCNCNARKEKLNQLLPYRFKARCFTEQEYNDWKAFTEVRTVRISAEQVRYICDLYASVFSRQVWYPCSTCSPKPLIDMISKLDKVYETYIV